MTQVEQMIKRMQKLEGERQPYATYWQDVAKYCIPRKAFITRMRSPGQKLDYDVYDTTAIQANLILAAGLHSYLTNPNSRWFALRIEDEQFTDDDDVKKWLSDTEDRIYNTINASNFNQQIHELYLDMGVFGIGCMYCEEDPVEVMRFYSRDIAEIFIVENERERVDTVYRKFELSAKQAFEKWGESAGKEVMDAMERGEYEKKLGFIHVVQPRDVYDRGKTDSLNMPFESIYIEPKRKHIVSQSGYQEFPYFTPRFNKNSGEVWGTGPAMASYADIKMINEMAKVLIRAAQKVVDPPIVLPHDGFLLPIKYGPGALNFRTRTTANDTIEPLIKTVNLPIGIEIINEYRTTIKKNYFVDLFLLLADPARKDMTATEVMQRVEEKMLILAPVLGRLMNEFLDPLINRVFNIMMRNNKLMPPPEQLANVKYNVEYISPLARAQKLDQMKSINSFLNIASGVATVKPEVTDKINGDEIIDDVRQLYGVNPKYINDDDVVEEIRTQRAEAMAQQQQMAMLQAGADTAKSAAEADATSRQAEGGPLARPSGGA